MVEPVPVMAPDRTPRVRLPPPPDNSGQIRRMDEPEDRLMHQEKTTQSLIDKAYRIKEDIIESMNLSHGSWQNEKEARTLLTDHIRNITVIVKRLSREIEVSFHYQSLYELLRLVLKLKWNFAIQSSKAVTIVQQRPRKSHVTF